MEKEIILLVGILLAIYNGQFLSLKVAEWHRTGFIIRLLLGLILYPNIIYMMIYLNIAWALYDIIINMYLKVPWYYIGRTAWIDKTIPHWINWAIKILILLTTIYSLINPTGFQI